MDNNLTNAIGIPSGKAALLAGRLNDLLSDYQLFYINTRGFHWNIRGEKFFELHLKFEELYNNIALKIDEVAERILTLGYTPFHSFEAFLRHSSIAPAENVSKGPDCVAIILKSFKILVVKQRELLELSAEAGDEGTNALMSDYIREQEKLVWMYTAWLNPS
jgi:starvation-inducible DNA-binding protein